jgi:hypothetical protein
VTGHLDIKGKKIYAGDKVSVIYYNNLYEAIVTRHSAASVFYKITAGTNIGYWDYATRSYKSYSVVGSEARTMTSERKLRILTKKEQ